MATFFSRAPSVYAPRSAVFAACAACAEPLSIVLGERLDVAEEQVCIGLEKLAGENHEKPLSATEAYSVLHAAPCKSCHRMLSVAFVVEGSGQLFVF